MRKNVDVGPGGNAFKEVSAFYLDPIAEAPLLDTLQKGRFLIDRDRQSDQLSRNSVSSWDVV